MLTEQYQEYFKTNQELWDRRVPVHLKSELYDQEAFMAGKDSLNDIERDCFGEVSGKTLLHLQCHFGQDTLSWARRGAKVTGVDFSPAALEKAEEMAQQLNLPARWVHANVYDVPEKIGEQFDLVFSTYGAIPWLPDMQAWAKVVAGSMRPGGLFYLAEFHPTLYLFNFDNHQVEYSYFNPGQPYIEEVEGTYADKLSGEGGGRECFWNHAICEVVNPLLENGLELLELNEYDYSPYNCFPNMKEREPGHYVWGNTGTSLPHIFALKMRKK